MTDYIELLTHAQDWASKTVTAGDLLQPQVQVLCELDNQDHTPLFSSATAQAAKPLLVAFMGGTGVGKSSLLNRLAGQAIAKAGLERPTSKEVTLYYHASLNLQKLPADLPINSVKTCQHEHQDQQAIIWMDMPDFDSIELSNHSQVKLWLPHIDVLIYVVSPERYRDNKTWQLLLNEGHKHAWLFVMNQWDRAQPEQYEDFKQQLAHAGFNDPMLFHTSCTETAGDDFAELLRQLHELASQHNIEQLSSHQQAYQYQQLKAALLEVSGVLVKQDFAQLQRVFQQKWQDTTKSLCQGMALPLQQMAKLWAEQPGQKPDIKLWDEWAQSRLDDVLDEVVLQAGQLQIPSKPLRAKLLAIKTQAEKKINHHTELAGREALLFPGNALQRFLLKLTLISETVLPLLCMTAVGYQVFTGYYRGINDSNAYLGVDFAIHSVLLIAISWLLPYFLHKKLQPSLQKNALRGLQNGLALALVELNIQIETELTKLGQRNIELQRELHELISKSDARLVNPLTQHTLLDRTLLNAEKQ